MQQALDAGTIPTPQSSALFYALNTGKVPKPGARHTWVLIKRQGAAVWLLGTHRGSLSLQLSGELCHQIEIFPSLLD